MKKEVHSSKRPTLRSCIIVLLLSALFLGIPYALIRRDRLTVLASYSTTPASQWNGLYQDYTWVSANAQVGLKFLYGDLQLLQHDNSTNQTEVLIPSMYTSFPLTSNLRSQFSPNGKWLLAEDFYLQTSSIMELKTKRISRMKYVNHLHDRTFWLQNGTQWVEMAYEAKLKGVIPILHSLSNPDLKLQPVPDPDCHFIGVTADLHALVASYGQSLMISDYGLNPHPHLTQKHFIELPRILSPTSNAELSDWTSEIRSSPDARRIAYLVHERHMKSISRLLLKYGATIRVFYSEETSIWVSQADGTKLRKVGSEPTLNVGDLRWTPDGKRVSVFINNQFYVISVPEQ